jgi:sugar phosphate isomerase/epimerase
MRVLCSTGAVTYYPTRADHRLVADARELPAGGFELSIAGDPRTRYLLSGEGSLDLDGFLARLREQCYDGAVTLEASAVDPDGELDRARLAEIAQALRRLDSAHAA